MDFLGVFDGRTDQIRPDFLLAKASFLDREAWRINVV